MQSDYNDIITHPHHVSSIHPPMSMEQRAAQFAPFAALTGHKEVIEQTAREHEESFVVAESDFSVEI